MLNELETKINVDVPVNITAAASEAVRGILAERKLEGYALRVYVSGGGCCGAQFGMALDNAFRDNDFTFDVSGIKLVVDDYSLGYLRGANVDFVNDPQRGAGFVIDNPLQAGGGTCACGGEGHAHAKEEGDACACGGSCGCGGH
jgi:iron-sulfur cluster assembly accessory protein